MSALAPVLEAFFTERLMTQRRASPNTITAYRDTFKLLLGYACQRTGKPPGKLDFADLDAPLISGFLQHLEPGEATASPPATPAWQPSTRCSATRRSRSPSTPR